MVNSSVGADAGTFPDFLMRRSYGRAGDAGSLVRTSRASGDLDLLRILLTPWADLKPPSRSNIRCIGAHREHNAQKPTKRTLRG
jgi:hypothetical protein